MAKIPVPIKQESRICFGIAWFESEADAIEWAKANRSTYNGGWFDGMPTGRDYTFDTVEDGRKLYAATC